MPPKPCKRRRSRAAQHREHAGRSSCGPNPGPACCRRAPQCLGLWARSMHPPRTSKAAPPRPRRPVPATRHRQHRPLPTPNWKPSEPKEPPRRPQAPVRTHEAPGRRSVDRKTHRQTPRASPQRYAQRQRAATRRRWRVLHPREASGLPPMPPEREPLALPCAGAQPKPPLLRFPSPRLPQGTEVEGPRLSPCRPVRRPDRRFPLRGGRAAQPRAGTPPRLRARQLGRQPVPDLLAGQRPCCSPSRTVRQQAERRHGPRAAGRPSARWAASLQCDGGLLQAQRCQYAPGALAGCRCHSTTQARHRPHQRQQEWPSVYLPLRAAFPGRRQQVRPGRGATASQQATTRPARPATRPNPSLNGPRR
mmetsp:Transcript_5192/g.22109  ORF Transcript_5192/g.22109 Transcript_5192/m.22109 type:complete len:363 (-) Transcript_5192:2241-3329(-)